MSLLGDAIRTNRKAAGLTLSRLAEILDISVPYLCDMELGNRSVPMGRLLQIVNFFPNVDLAEWLWLRLSDEWGTEIAHVMKRYAVAVNAAERPQEPISAASTRGDGSDGGHAREGA